MKENRFAPPIRFKEFIDDWKQKKFSEEVILCRGLTYSPNDIRTNGIRVLRSSNVNEGRFTTNEDDVFVDENAINIDYAQNGDILITGANGSTELVGKHAIIRDLPNNSAVHGGFMLLGRTPYPNFINASMSSPWYKNFIYTHVTGGNGAIGNLKKSELDDCLFMVPSISEQIKIGNFFEKLDSLVAFHQYKYETLKKYKEGLIQNGIKLLKEENNMIPFKDLFVPFDQKNKHKLSQYTVGINGLSPLDDIRYDISNHKVFTDNCLILGIGIEEIGISENLQGSISPVYDVYKIANHHYTKFMKYFLKPLLYEKRRFITRKSTRREFEIDSKELLKTKIEMPTNENFLIYVSALETIDNLIKDLDVKCEKLKSIKGFLLNNLFV